jgi:hypothetical protein
VRKRLALFLPITLNSSSAGFRMSWAGRLAWNDRSVGIAEATGSNPVPSTIKTDGTSCWVFSSIQAQNSRIRPRSFLPPPCSPERVSTQNEVKARSKDCAAKSGFCGVKF